jgi:molecular chaperone DnaJ
VLCEVPITFTQAALGAEIQVPTLDGKVTYTIPEGTQTGKEFIIRDKGIPEVNNPRRRGSHRFTVVVETPTKLTKEQRELLRQLEETMEETPKRKKFFKILKDLFD